MRPITVAHIGHFAPNAVNGVAVAGWWLAAAEAATGARVLIYSLGRQRMDEEGANAVARRTFVPLPVLPIPLSRQLGEWILANRDNLDIIHLHSVFTPLNAYVAYCAARARIPYIITPSGGYDPHVFWRHRWKKVPYYLAVEKRLLSGASGIHCVVRREIADIERLGFPGPFVVAPNLCDLSILSDGADHAPGSHVVWLGRFDVVHKGLDRLLHIWSRVERMVANVELHLYGSGSGRDGLERLIRLLNLKRVAIHPPVFDKQKAAVLAGARLYVHLSRWEVFGISIVEAMASGTPVALSRGCYIGDEVAEAGGGIILSDNGDCCVNH